MSRYGFGGSIQCICLKWSSSFFVEIIEVTQVASWLSHEFPWSQWTINCARISLATNSSQSILAVVTREGHVMDGSAADQSVPVTSLNCLQPVPCITTSPGHRRLQWPRISRDDNLDCLFSPPNTARSSDHHSLDPLCRYYVVFWIIVMEIALFWAF